MSGTKNRRKDADAIAPHDNGIGSEELRDRLGEYLNRVEYGGEQIPIKRKGKVIARLVPVASTG